MYKKLSGIAYAAFTAALCVGSAYAQETDEIVVTGSHIRGTPEDAALPVDVFGREDLAAAGNPTLLEFTRNLPASQGINSESNQYGSNRLEGLGNVNLRGLGPGRTLVLINGQRQAPAGFSVAEFGAQQFVDTNSIPMAAVGRVEVLKDGAAATYGSDAVAGVVNFITRSNFEGFEISGSMKEVGGEAFADDYFDGDASITYGWQGENTGWVTTLGYVSRDSIGFNEVDWALRSYADSGNGLAGLWSGISNPDDYVAVMSAYGPGITPGYGSVSNYPSLTALPNFDSDPITAGVQSISRPDQGCGDYSGGPGGIWGPVLALGQCRFNSVAFGNMVETEQRVQLFSEFNHDFDNGMQLHLEGLLAKSEAGYETSPSFPPPVVNLQYMPYDNPAVQQLIADLTSGGATVPAGFVDWDDVYSEGAVYQGRIFGPGGQGAGDDSIGCCVNGPREYENLRLAGNVTGTFDSGWMNGIDYSFSLAFSRAQAGGYTEDLQIDRVRLGMLGLGGPDCNPVTDTPGVGDCYWLSTYSTTAAGHALDPSSTNPNFVLPPNTNTRELIEWLVQPAGFTATNELTVGEAVFSGETPIEMPGGNIAWAAGAQIRAEAYQVDPLPLSDAAENPCPTIGDITCGSEAGTFQFIPPWNHIRTSRSIYALFTEFSLPITDDLNMQVAARYEQYGGQQGSTFDPKIQVRWQAADFLALRASAQTTFRAPTLNQLEETSAAQEPLVGLNFISYDLSGNRNLTPESAFNYNLGAIFDFQNIGGSNVSWQTTVDYWNFNLQDPIIREGSAIVNATLLADNCSAANPFYDRLTFQPGGSGCAGVARVAVNLINGPEVNTDGIDVSSTLTIDDVLGGTFSVGVDGSYILTYDVGAYDFDQDGTLEAGVGGLYPETGFDALGFLNKASGYRPLPQWKANATFRYVNGPHSLAVSGHYVTEYEDRRYADTNVAAGNVTQTEMRHIDSMMTWDLNYTVELPWDMNVGLTVYNVGDEEPPEVFQEQFYDPYTHNPFGRMIKVGFTQRF
ncbi:MAG: TonB-dependent receptor [Hyphomonadaceae bacterium]